MDFRIADDERCDALDLLTDQQSRVVTQVAEGKTNREIAEELELSPNTVRNYLARAMDRLRVRNRVEVATLMARCVDRLLGRSN